MMEWAVFWYPLYQSSTNNAIYLGCFKTKTVIQEQKPKTIHKKGSCSSVFSESCDLVFVYKKSFFLFCIFPRAD